MLRLTFLAGGGAGLVTCGVLLVLSGGVEGFSGAVGAATLGGCAVLLGLFEATVGFCVGVVGVGVFGAVGFAVGAEAAPGSAAATVALPPKNSGWFLK